jgi:hypothetical protein
MRKILTPQKTSSSNSSPRVVYTDLWRDDLSHSAAETIEDALGVLTLGDPKH